MSNPDNKSTEGSPRTVGDEKEQPHKDKEEKKEKKEPKKEKKEKKQSKKELKKVISEKKVDSETTPHSSSPHEKNLMKIKEKHQQMELLKLKVIFQLLQNSN